MEFMKRLDRGINLLFKIFFSYIVVVLVLLLCQIAYILFTMKAAIAVLAVSSALIIYYGGWHGSKSKDELQ